MKLTTLALIALFLFSCEDDPVKPLTGCRTARDKTDGDIVFLRCEMIEEFNPTNIRSSQWDTTDSLYYDYQWEECEQCK